MATVRGKRELSSVEAKVKTIREIETENNKCDVCREFSILILQSTGFGKTVPKLLVSAFELTGSRKTISKV